MSIPPSEPVDHVAFTVGGAQSLPWEDGAFDAVFCTLGLHHVPEADREVALAEMLRVLAPGGRAVIVEFAHGHGWSLHPGALLHRRHAPAILDQASDTMRRVWLQARGAIDDVPYPEIAGTATRADVAGGTAIGLGAAAVGTFTVAWAVPW